MFNNLSTPLSLLLTRRSAKARDLVLPGPDAAELGRIIDAASRVPDHGKLAPWRFIHIPADGRDAFAALLTAAYLAEKPEAGRLELEAMESFARQAPCLIALLSTPVAGSKIPLWEQQLSAGAAAMQLANAVHASGYAACWLTGWPASSTAVAQALGATGAEDRIVGFSFIGTPSRPLEERPRPERSQIWQEWPFK